MAEKWDMILWTQNSIPSHNTKCESTIKKFLDIKGIWTFVFCSLLALKANKQTNEIDHVFQQTKKG